MPETIWQVLFDFKCPLCRLSEKVREKIRFGDFPALFFTRLWHFPRSSVQLCAGERLWSAVSKSPDAVGRQIGVHRRGTSLCRLPPICSCIFFLSFSSRFPSHLLMRLVCVRTLQAQNWIAFPSKNYCSCSFQSIAGACGETRFEKKLVLPSCTVLVLYRKEGFSLCGC